MKSRLLISILAMVILSISRPAASQGQYSVTRFGHLGGGSASARGINDLGQVVGSSVNAAGDSRPFLWQNGVMVDIGSPGYSDAEATDINNLGQISGNASNNNDPNGVGVFYTGGTMSVLPGLGDGTTFTRGLGDSGTIIGSSFRSGQFRSVLWVDGVIHELRLNQASDVSDGGVIVGSQRFTFFEPGYPFPILVDRATVLFPNGTAFDLGGFEPARESYGRAINNNGVVVGEAWRGSNFFPFIYRPSTGIQLLDPFAPGNLDMVRDINDHDYVVGRAFGGFVCPPGGPFTNLNDKVPSGWAIADATRINNRGQILAIGSFDGGAGESILLSPISLTASPSTLHAGAPLTVSWNIPPGHQDWVGLYRVGAGDEQYLWWTYTGDTSPGSRTIEAPSPAGPYEFRYFRNNSFERVGTSNPITSEVPQGYSVTANPSVIGQGGVVNVRWTAPVRDKISDWVGLFQVGATNHQYLWWRFTDGTTSGEFNVPMPNEPGQYEFRYLYQTSYTELARSAPVTVGAAASYTVSVSPMTVPSRGVVNVSWTAPAASSATDWVGLYREGEADNHNYLWPHWFYTGGSATGTTPITMPDAPGRYVFRYLLNNGYTHKAESAVITVN